MAKDKAPPDVDNQADENDDPEGYSVYILRHGIAGERDAQKYPDDSERPLTDKGKKRMRQIADGLIRIGFAVDWIVTSPLVRAAETAEVVAASIGVKIPMDKCAPLSPGGSVRELATFLSGHADRKRILLVGHEPDLSRLAARLIGAGREANLALKKGGCCLIQCGDLSLSSDGTLIWWLTPRLMRVLARGA